MKKAATGAVAAKKKKQQRKSSGRQSGGQSTQAAPEQVAGAVQDDTIDPDEETYCLCGQVNSCHIVKKEIFLELIFLTFLDFIWRDDSM